MTRLPDHMFTGGAQLMGGDIPYQMNNDHGGNSPGNVMNLFPNTSGFYAQKINDDLYTGIGLYGNYGLGIDFGNWAGDRLIKKSTMVAMTLSPSLAWKLNDRLSVGASANLNYGYLSLTRNVDGNDEKDKDHDWAMSYRLGLLMQLTDQTRAGITWNSKTDYNFNVKGKARFPHLPNVAYDLPISAQVRAPQQIMLSMVHDINKQWSVMGDLGWQDWSQFGSPQITVVGHESHKNNRLKDSWHTATGAQYQITPASNIGVAVSYLHMQSSHVKSPEIVSGSYDHPYLWFASVNYSYQF